MEFLLILIIIGIIAFAIYGVKKNNEIVEDNRYEYRRDTKMIKCPMCGNQVSNRARSCPNCGHPIDTKIYCPNCHGTNIKTIGGFTKGASVAAFGAFAANTVKSTYQCQDCYTKF